MLGSVRIYFEYFLQFLKSRLSYRLDFLAGIMANLVSSIVGLAFISFLIDGTMINGIQGWSRDEVLFIYGYSMLSMSVFGMFAYNLYRFGDRFVIQGQFDRVLLRPVNSLFQVIFESFNLDALGTLLSGIGVLLYSSANLGIHYTALDILWLIISTLSGAVILLGIFIILASLSFHFEDRIGIAAPVYNLISFGRYPLPIFGKVIQFLLCWVFPFAFVAFFPATHFLNRAGFEAYCYSTPLMAIAVSALAAAFWRLGVSRYASTGS